MRYSRTDTNLIALPKIKYLLIYNWASSFLILKKKKVGIINEQKKSTNVKYSIMTQTTV